MPDENDVLISQLSTKAVNPLTMFELENTTDGEPDSGKTDASALGNFFLGQGTLPLEYADLQTTAKTPIGAINELDDEIADKAEIDDSTISADSAYSSQKIISLMPTNEASGAVANFNTQLAAPLVSDVAQITAVQSGTGDPSPSNVRPISGFTGANITHTGKNILNLNTRSSATRGDITSEIQSDNHIIASGVSSGNGDIVCNTDLFLTSDTYTLSLNGTDTRTGTLYLILHIKNGDYLSPISISNASHSVVISDKAGLYDSFILRTASGGSVNLNCKLQIEVGSTATSFESFNADTYTINFVDGENPLTVYGGSLDVKTGVLTVDSIISDFSQNTWYKNENQNRFYTRISTDYKLSNSYSVASNIICDSYKNTDFTTLTSGSTNNLIAGLFTNNNNYISIRDTRYSTAESFKEYADTISVVLKLATPITYQLTPQQITAFVGVNNIWHDANGDTTVEFKQDIQGYIDEKIASVQALVLNS